MGKRGGTSKQMKNNTYETGERPTRLKFGQQGLGTFVQEVDGRRGEQLKPDFKDIGGFLKEYTQLGREYQLVMSQNGDIVSFVKGSKGSVLTKNYKEIITLYASINKKPLLDIHIHPMVGRDDADAQFFSRTDLGNMARKFEEGITHYAVASSWGKVYVVEMSKEFFSHGGTGKDWKQSTYDKFLLATYRKGGKLEPIESKVAQLAKESGNFKFHVTDFNNVDKIFKQSKAKTIDVEAYKPPTPSKPKKEPPKKPNGPPLSYGKIKNALKSFDSTKWEKKLSDDRTILNISTSLQRLKKHPTEKNRVIVGLDTYGTQLSKSGYLDAPMSKARADGVTSKGINRVVFVEVNGNTGKTTYISTLNKDLSQIKLEDYPPFTKTSGTKTTTTPTKTKKEPTTKPKTTPTKTKTTKTKAASNNTKKTTKKTPTKKEPKKTTKKTPTKKEPKKTTKKATKKTPTKKATKTTTKPKTTTKTAAKASVEKMRVLWGKSMKGKITKAEDKTLQNYLEKNGYEWIDG